LVFLLDEPFLHDQKNYDIFEGKNKINPGKRIQRLSATKHMTMNGRHAPKIPSRDTSSPATALTANTSIPMGGVILPMFRQKTVSTPNQTGSHPKPSMGDKR
jgi:hypothetical protein